MCQSLLETASALAERKIWNCPGEKCSIASKQLDGTLPSEPMEIITLLSQGCWWIGGYLETPHIDGRWKADQPMVIQSQASEANAMPFSVATVTLWAS